MENLQRFLKDRGVQNENIQRLVNDKIDPSLILEMKDEELCRYIPSYGDRLATVVWCKTNLPEKQEERRNTGELFDRLRNKMSNRRKRGQGDFDSHKGNKNAKRASRRIEVGWMDYDQKSGTFKQVRSQNGGGTRHLSVFRDAEEGDILAVAKQLFFPNGESKKGNEASFLISIKDFKGEEMGEKTVSNLYEDTKVKILRLYMHTKRADDARQDQTTDVILNQSITQLQNRISPLAAIGAPPAAIGVPPAATGVPPAATGAPPAAIGVPPAATTGVPPAATGAPPAAIGVPPAATTGVPPAATGAPPAAIGVPPAAIGVPPAATGAPPAAIGVPPAATTGAPPAATGAPPAATTGVPPAATGAPPAATTGVPPAATGAPPAAIGAPPAAIGVPPAATGAPPAAIGAPPAAIGVPPAATTGVPPAATGAPPAAIGAPPAAIGVPPAATGAPPAAIGVPPAATTGVPPAATGAPPAAIGVPPAAIGAPPAAIGVPPAATGVPPAATGAPPAAIGVPPAATTGVPPAATGAPPAAIGVPPTDGAPPAAIGVPPAAIGVPPAATGSPPTAIGEPSADGVAPAATGSPPADGGSTRTPSTASTGTPTVVFNLHSAIQSFESDDTLPDLDSFLSEGGVAESGGVDKNSESGSNFLITYNSIDSSEESCFPVQPSSSSPEAVGHSESLHEILTRLASRINTERRNIVNVTRHCVMSGAIRAFNRLSFNPENGLSVEFTGEHAIDDGGPSREFLRLLMKEISSLSIFSGDDIDKMLDLNYADLQRGLYLTAGKMIAFSVVHNGPLPRFFSPLLFSTLVGDNQNQPTLNDIKDIAQRESLLKIKNAKDMESFLEAIGCADQLIQLAGCYPLTRSFARKEELCNALIHFIVLGRIKECLDQFTQGLDTFGVLADMRQHSKEVRELFCFDEKYELDASSIEILFSVESFSEPGSYRRRMEEMTISYWNDYLLDVAEGTESVTLRDILVFATGAGSIPPLGLHPQPQLTFHSAMEVDPENRENFPRANTCANVLDIPMISDYTKFKKYMNAAINVNVFTSE